MSELLPIADGPELREPGPVARGQAQAGADRDDRPARRGGDSGSRGAGTARPPRAVRPGRDDAGVCRQARAGARRVPARADGADLVRAARLVRPRGEDLRRASGRTSCAACSACRSRRSSGPGPGDLISRTTADVDSLARTIRFADSRDADRGSDDRSDRGSGVLGQPGRGAALPHGHPGSLDRYALVPQARAGRIPLGARHLRDARGPCGGDGRGRADDRRARPTGGARRPDRRRPRGGVSGRAADASAPHDLVPDGGVLLRASGGGGARLGRLAGLERERHHRRGHRDRALRRAARRPRRPAGLVAGRDPGRRDLVRAPRRDRAGAAGPDGDGRRARR